MTVPSFRLAPYKHADGSNCWTKNCSRNSKNFTPDEFMISLVKNMNPEMDDSEATIKAKEIFGPKQVRHYPTPTSMKDITQLGGVVNRKFKFRSSIVGDFDINKFTPPANPVELSWTKPDGGLWLATVDDSGEDGWTQLVGSVNSLASMKKEKPDAIKQFDFEFTNTAKVIIINTKADYEMVLQNYPYFTSETPENLDDYTLNGYGGRHWSQVNKDGTPRRGINWEALTKDGYGAVLVTWAGLNNNSNDKEESENRDVSLKRWELESAFVLQPDAIKVSKPFVGIE